MGPEEDPARAYRRSPASSASCLEASTCCPRLRCCEEGKRVGRWETGPMLRFAAGPLGGRVRGSGGRQGRHERDSESNGQAGKREERAVERKTRERGQTRRHLTTAFKSHILSHSQPNAHINPTRVEHTQMRPTAAAKERNRKKRGRQERGTHQHKQTSLLLLLSLPFPLPPSRSSSLHAPPRTWATRPAEAQPPERPLFESSLSCVRRSRLKNHFSKVVLLALGGAAA